MVDAAVDLVALDPVHDQAVAAGGGDLLHLVMAVGNYNSNMTRKRTTRNAMNTCRFRKLVRTPDMKNVIGLDGFTHVVEAIQGMVWSSAVTV